MELANKLKVVIVEDELRICNVLKSKIESLSPCCEVVATANNGESGYEAICTYKPDIVFTDIKMPIMSGLDLVKKVHQKYPDMPFVIISGYSDFSYAKKAIQYGVFNYILKPIDDDELQNTIEDIRRIIKIKNNLVGSNVIHSNKWNVSDNKSDKYYVFSITLGNLYYNNLDMVVFRYFKKIQSSVDWLDLMEHFGVQERSWLVSDELTKNHVNIVVEKDDTASGEKLANIIFKYLKKVVRQDIVINICYSTIPVQREETWGTIHKLRKVLNDTLVIGKSRVMSLEQELPTSNKELLDIIKIKINDTALDFSNIKNQIDFRKETGLIFSYVISKDPTQRLFEKILLYIIRKFEFSFKEYDLDVFNDLQMELFRKICMAANYSDVQKSFMDCINVFFESSKKVKDIGFQNIFDYVEANFTKNISLEKVAEKFNYSSTHITRLFKKHLGQSFTRYIINKRMNMAKELIKKSDYCFNTIAQMIGYEDGRYFSRVFKIETGISPSEYKSSCSKTS